MEFPTCLANFKIRSATKADTPLILSFIRALADYEKLAHEVVATEDDIERSIFGERPFAEVLLGFEGEQPVGFALFFPTFSTFLGKPGIYLEDLFVQPDCRGKGFGKQLLSCLARIAVERGCGRLEWSVLDWNEPAINFYHALGAKSMNGWTVNRVSGSALEELADKSSKS